MNGFVIVEIVIFIGIIFMIYELVSAYRNQKKFVETGEISNQHLSMKAMKRAVFFSIFSVALTIIGSLLYVFIGKD